MVSLDVLVVLKSFAETWRSHPNGGTPSLPFNGGKPGGTSAAAGGTPSLHRFLRPLFFPFNINVLY